MTAEGNREALDPDFALGHAALALTHNHSLSFGWMINEREDREETERAIRQALDLDRNDAGSQRRQCADFCGQTWWSLFAAWKKVRRYSTGQ